MDQCSTKRLWRVTMRVLAAVGISIALSGCIVEPLWGPHHYRPYYGYHGGY